MAINYIEKGYELHVAIHSAGFQLVQRNGEWISDNDVEVQKIIDNFIPVGPILVDVTARQIRLSLIKNNISLTEVESIINSLPSELSEKATIEWEYSNTFKRNHALVGVIGAIKGLTSDQIDKIWVDAYEL